MLLFKEVAGICTLNNKWYLFGLSCSAKIPGQNWCWALLLQNSLWVQKCQGFGLRWEDTRLTLRWSLWWAAGDGSGLFCMVGVCQPSLGSGQPLWWSQSWRSAFCRQFLTDQSSFQTEALDSDSLDFGKYSFELWAASCAPSRLVRVRSLCSHWSCQWLQWGKRDGVTQAGAQPALSRVPGRGIP